MTAERKAVILSYRSVREGKKLAMIKELFSPYMEPLCRVSRGTTGEADTGKRDYRHR
jgi:hypothetical protein